MRSLQSRGGFLPSGVQRAARLGRALSGRAAAAVVRPPTATVMMAGDRRVGLGDQAAQPASDGRETGHLSRKGKSMMLLRKRPFSKGVKNG